jgi:MFS family permease
MQTVGAQWFLIHQAHAAILVSLVQTADMLPNVMFGIVGGVLADTLDRRRLLIAVQAGLVVATAILAALTIAGRMSPALLLLFTFMIGSGSVMVLPAYQSLVPEFVPRSDIPAAAQLSSININLTRAVGPAIAGILISYIGVGAVFAVNAATFLFYGVVVALWRARTRRSLQRFPRDSCQRLEPAADTSGMRRLYDGYCSELPSSSFRGALSEHCFRSSPAVILDLTRVDTAFFSPPWESGQSVAPPSCRRCGPDCLQTRS